MSRNYKHTFRAACTGYIVQAAVNTLAPLLFIAFQTQFGFSRLQITSLITLNFTIQLGVDLVSASFVDKIGYRAAAILSQALATIGLAGMGTLPYLTPEPYTGLVIAMVFSALGGGLLEVIISPIVEALPTESKSSSMSLLHSFYCWGCVLVIVLSTVYFSAAGIRNWRWLPLLWALLPAANLIVFTRVPLRTLLSENEVATPMRSLLKNGVFWLLLAAMLCGGASEQAMSQWASLFAETGLGVSKTMGDLLGPCLFAVLMGLARVYFGAKDRGFKLGRVVMAGAVLCAVSYLLTVFSPWPILSLLGCGLTGLSVAIFWPGVFSLTACRFPRGGTAMFAILALAGDLGCSFGPSLVGWGADALQNSAAAKALFGADPAQAGLRSGLMLALVFPLLLFVLMAVFVRLKRPAKPADRL